MTAGQRAGSSDGAPIRVAVVGLGWAGRQIWLPRLAANPAYRVVAVVDPDRVTRAELLGAGGLGAGGLGDGGIGDGGIGTGGIGAGGIGDGGIGDGVAGYDNVDELPAELVDLAVVAVPNHLHATIASRLLRRGIAVFLEKPVCLSSRETLQLAAAERDGGAVLLAGSAARYRADVQTLCEVAGTLGRIRHVDVGWVRARGVPGAGGWFTQRRLAGGGVLVDLGWHLLDTVLPLLGPGRIEQVIGSVSDDFINDGSHQAAWRGDDSVDTRTSDVEDTVRAFLVTEHGVSAAVHASWASHVARDTTTITVEGSAGTARLRCTFGFSPNRDPEPVLTRTCGGHTVTIPLPAEPIGAEYGRQLDALPALLADPASRGATIAEARQTVRIIERVYSSARLAQPRRQDVLAGEPAR